MTFDRIDRQFRRAPDTTIRLECASCGVTDGVVMIYPLWAPRQPGYAVPEPLCAECSRRQVPVCK